MITYSQRDNRWANITYSAVPPHNETIKSSGCGVTSAAMVLSNLTEKIVYPTEMASYSVKNGYRIDGVGTSFELFYAIAKDYNLDYKQVYTIEEAMSCVKNGGMVICSTNGGSTGLFSTGGHLFLLTGVEDRTCIFWDTDNYVGKYDVYFRKNKVKIINDYIYVDKEIARREITTYFCFEKEKIDMDKLKELEERINRLENPMVYDYIDVNMPEWAVPTVKKLVASGIIKGDETGRLGLSEEILRVLVILDRSGKI